MIHIALLGNCQVDVYRQLFEATQLAGIAVSATEIWRHKPAEFESIHKRIADADIVVTQELGDHYGPLATSSLRSSARQVLVIQNIFFQGYHPDCAYVGPLGARIKSPVGDYNSQTAFDQWRAGRSVDEGLAALQAFGIQRVLKVFEASRKEILLREARADVKISDQVLEPGHGHRMMFTFNHPTIELHRIYLQRILRALQLPGDVGTCADPLLKHTHWPLYPAVLKALKLPETGQPLRFRAPASLGATLFDPRGFVEKSYAAYERSGFPKAGA